MAAQSKLNTNKPKAHKKSDTTIAEKDTSIKLPDKKANVLLLIFKWQRADVPFSKKQLATLSKYTEGSLTNVLTEFKKADLVISTKNPKAPYALTELANQIVTERFDGMDMELDLSKGNENAQKHLRDLITGQIGKDIFDYMCENGGRTFAVSELQEHFGYDNAKSFGNIISKLVTANVAMRPANGQVRVVDAAFPFGRP